MSGAAWSSRWLITHSCIWPMANRPACLRLQVPLGEVLNIVCDYEFVLSVYLMNVVSHHTWCSGNISRVHYESIKCDVYFSQGSVSTLLTWGGHFSYMCITISNYNKKVITRWEYPNVTWRISSYLFTYLRLTIDSQWNGNSTYIPLNLNLTLQNIYTDVRIVCLCLVPLYTIYRVTRMYCDKTTVNKITRFSLQSS